MDQDGADLADGRRVGPPPGARPGGAEAPLRPVRAVVFDLDGTLLDTEHCYRAAFDAALAELGWALPDGSYDGLVGLPSPARRAILPRLLGASFPVGAFFGAYHRHREAALGDAVRLKPGVEAALDLLDDAGLAYAIATSASAPTASANLASAGLLRRFAVVVTRDDVACGKPHPESFLAACSRLGEAPENCLAIEDSAAGVAAAHAAGMMVAIVPDRVPPSPDMLERCVARLDSLHGLGALLAGELARKNNRSRQRA